MADANSPANDGNPEEELVKRKGAEDFENLENESVSEMKPEYESTYKLKPNQEYVSNGYKYQTDSKGRIIHTSGKLRLEKGVRNSTHQRKAGGDNRIVSNEDIRLNDDGGHLIATIFGGSGKIENIVAMNSNVNRSAYKQLENTWAAALKKEPPSVVNVEIQVVYDDVSERPSSFIINYTMDGVKQTPVELKNQYGG